MAPPKKLALPKPLPDGFILTDTEKKKWRLGRIIGQGGFGLIYLGTDISVLVLFVDLSLQSEQKTNRKEAHLERSVL